MYVIGDLYRVEQGDGTGVFFLAIGVEGEFLRAGAAVSVGRTCTRVSGSFRCCHREVSDVTRREVGEGEVGGAVFGRCGSLSIGNGRHDGPWLIVLVVGVDRVSFVGETQSERDLWVWARSPVGVRYSDGIVKRRADRAAWSVW